jgi:hypothetical protein
MIIDNWLAIRIGCKISIIYILHANFIFTSNSVRGFQCSPMRNEVEKIMSIWLSQPDRVLISQKVFTILLKWNPNVYYSIEFVGLNSEGRWRLAGRQKLACYHLIKAFLFFGEITKHAVGTDHMTYTIFVIGVSQYYVTHLNKCNHNVRQSIKETLIPLISIITWNYDIAKYLENNPTMKSSLMKS